MGAFSFLPSFTTSIAAGFVGLAVYYLSWIVYTRFFHPYKDIPGPFWASVSDWWYFRAIRYGRAQDMQLPVHKKYGPFVRIAPNEVSIADASAIDIVYNSKNIWEKTEFYESFSPRIEDRIDLFTVRNEQIHTQARKIVAPLFTQGSVLEYEPCIDRIVEVFCNCMDELAQSGKEFDMSVYLRKYSFDAIGEMFYGREGGFGMLRDNVDYNGWLEMLDNMVPIVSSLAYIPKGVQTMYLMSQLLTSSQTRKGLKQAATVVEQSNAAVADRRKLMAEGKHASRNDFMSKLTAIVDAKDKDVDFNDGDIAVNVWVIIWAGSDTTGYVLTSIIYHVVKYPEVYKRLVAEVEEAFRNKKLTYPCRYNDAIKLPYLSACIKEAMRVQPAVGTGLPRYVPKGGAVIGGHFFPEGYKVIMNPNAVHFDKKVFGEDAEEYNPDRWLRCDEKTAGYMSRHDMGFGIGKRMCIGKQVTMTEMYKLLPVMIHKFDFKLAEPDVIKVKNCWFQTPQDVMMTVKKR